MGMQNEIKLDDQARFLIFTFNFDIIHNLSLYMLVQRSHSIAMFAAHALGESNSHVYIRCTYNTRIQYRRPFPYRADQCMQFIMYA